MPTVLVNWLTANQQLPFGSVVDHYVITLQGTGGPVPSVRAPAMATSAEVLGVDPGDYSANVQAMDAADTPLGPAAVSDVLNVHPDVIDVPMPVTVTVSQVTPAP